MTTSAPSNKCPTCKRPHFRRHGLTAMEWRVADLVYLGRSNKEIAAELNIAFGTVKTHVYGINQTLKAKGRGQLILKIGELKRLDSEAS